MIPDDNLYMTGQPGPSEPDDPRERDILDLIDEEAAQITDADIENRLRKTLRRAADTLSAERERTRQIKARETWEREDELRKGARDRADVQYQRQTAHNNAELRFRAKLAELQAQAEIVSAGIARGLLDHQTFDEVMGALSGVLKELEGASDADKETPVSAAEQQGAWRRPGDPTLIDAEIVQDTDIA